METKLLVYCLGFIGLAYLIGSIPFGYLVARARGVNILREGSGNIGATNVSRVLGKRLGVLVFLLDLAKGALPTLLAHFPVDLGGDVVTPPQGLPVWAGLAAFLGHCFPLFLGFRGGKGVATGAGVVLVLMPLPTLAGLAAWVVVLAAFRMVSLASLVAAVVLAGCYYLTTDEPFQKANLWRTIFCAVAVLLVFARHRGNLGRLIQGTEPSMKESNIMTALVRILHVLALGLWFGSSVFFSFVVAVLLFNTLESMAAKPEAERPLWFPVPVEYQKDDVRKEQGTRAAGFAIGPMFELYFPVQGACGFVALITALGWLKLEPRGRQRLRAVLIGLALVTVLAGWPLEHWVSRLREERNVTGEAYLVLRSLPERKTDKKIDLDKVRANADSARAEFGRWHTVSLFLNFGTIALVGVAMGMAAFLPTQDRRAGRVNAPVIAKQPGR